MQNHVLQPVEAEARCGVADLSALFDPLVLSLLNQVRFQAVSCRAEKYLAFDEACKLIQIDEKMVVEQHISAFIRVLEQALGRRPVIHAPKASAMSFDEKWLLQVFQQIMIDDRAGVHFLVRSRVSRYKQRSFASLVRRMIDAKMNSL